MYRLNNPIRSYAWGSYTAIASFLGTGVRTAKPQAELWIGAHPDSPSEACRDGAPPQALNALLEADPDELLGSETIAAFGKKLPFLTKVLAAENALSLQVHPNREQALEGFRREKSLDLNHDDPKRNYKDDNHKPEMLVALTDFSALCGFRDPTATAALFRKLADACRYDAKGVTVPQLLEWIVAVLAAEDKESGPKERRLRRVFERLISDPQAPKLVETVAGALEAWLPRQRDLPETVVRPLEAVLELYRLFPGDPGVLLSVMLNYVRLKPGEALFLPAGNIHAYLKGMGVEVMASSDNVLRGGLTTKRVDVAELLKLVDFRVLPAPIMEAAPIALGQKVFKPPIKDFQVQEITLTRGSVDCAPIIRNGPLVVLCVKGEAAVETAVGRERLTQADSVFIGANEASVTASLPLPAKSCRLFAITVATD